MKFVNDDDDLVQKLLLCQQQPVAIPSPHWLYDQSSPFGIVQRSVQWPHQGKRTTFQHDGRWHSLDDHIWYVNTLVQPTRCCILASQYCMEESTDWVHELSHRSQAKQCWKSTSLHNYSHFPQRIPTMFMALVFAVIKLILLCSVVASFSVSTNIFCANLSPL